MGGPVNSAISGKDAHWQTKSYAPSFVSYSSETWRKSAQLRFLLILFLGLTSGCASRKPVASRQPPSASSSTPESTEEANKNSTSAPPPSALSKKRRKDGSVAVTDGYTEEGEASWYGAPFHGRQASNGEIYDMNKLTAAHRTLPFETVVRVTNEKNGKSTVVRITDRGPFVNNRIIDLSYAAARELESIGPGVVPVRLEVLSAGADPEAGFFTIQVG
jgi:rare lipoprotein A